MHSTIGSDAFPPKRLNPRQITDVRDRINFPRDHHTDPSHTAPGTVSLAATAVDSAASWFSLGGLL